VVLLLVWEAEVVAEAVAAVGEVVVAS